MRDIINKIYKYFNRYPIDTREVTNVSWQTIKKELARVNINSMLITMPINHDSKLLFPFIVKDKEDNYQLVSSISKEGLVIDQEVVVYDTFENDYSKELMLLEKSEYIENERNDIQSILSKNRNIISILLLAVFLILTLINSTDIVGYVILTIGLLISIYTKAKENKGKLNSSFCINKGIFSCNKTKSYQLLGIPFFDISIMYHSAALICCSFLGLTIGLKIITAIGLCFCVYCLFLQFFKEKKICLLCIFIFLAFSFNAFWLFKPFGIPDIYRMSDELSTILVFLISGLFGTLYFNDQEIETKRKARDFDTVMSQKSMISMFSKKNDNIVVDSNLIIGASNSINIIRLYIHMACKHCPEALREILNLALLNEDYCIHLYIRSDNRDVDIYYFGLIENAIKNENHREIYNLYMKWKSVQKSTLPNIKNNSNFNIHREIVEKSNIEFYPTLFIDDVKISSFPRFENIKVALMK